MKRTWILAMLLAFTSLVHATERPTVAILPFGVAKDRNSLQWLSFATASTFTEKLRRIPSVRVLPFSTVVQELRAADIDPLQAAWTPAVATTPLGKWLKTERVLLGAIGKIRDQKIANIILQSQEPPAPQKGSQIWLAARVIDIETGHTLGNAYIEGHADHIFDLQNQLLTALGSALNIDNHLSNPILQTPPENDMRVYKSLAEAEAYILELPLQTREKDHERTLNRAIKRVKRALRRDAESAWAHSMQGTIDGLRNRPKAATKAFETAIEKDPEFTTPRYGLVDLALQQEDLPTALIALNEITQIAPHDDEAYHLQGTIYRLLNQPEQALEAYEKSLEAYSKRPETQYEAGRLYLTQGQTRKAILALQQAVAQMPGQLVYQIALADAHLTAQETARARVVLDRIANVSESDPEYQFVRGKFEHQIENYDRAITHFNNALETLPNRADIYVAKGKTLVAQRRYTSAIDAFINAQSLNAKLPEIALPFGDALEAQNQKPEAEDLYRQTLQQAPSRADIRLRLIKHLLNRSATQEATEVLRVGVNLHPDRGDFHLLLGDLYAAQNEIVLAIRHYEKAIELGVNPRDVASQLGQLYLAQNQPERAKQYFEQAHQAGAANAELYAGLGQAEEQLGNQRAALQAYRQALKVTPNNNQIQENVTRLSRALRPKPQAPSARDYAIRAQQAQATGNLTAAQNAYQKALSMSPKRADWWSSLGTIYAQSAQTQQAEKAFQNAIQNAPKTPEYRYNLSKLYTDMGWFYDAESVCREALDIDPNYQQAHQQLGTIYLAQGEYQRARTTFEALIKKDTSNTAAQLGLGNALSALGEWSLAQKAYQAAQQVGSAATIGLGNLQLAQGDTVNAISYYQQAIQKDAQNPTPHINMGLIYAAQGQYEQALSAYQKALNLSPQNPDVLTNLIALYARTEQYDDALDLCQTLQEIHPDDDNPKQITGAVAYAAGQFELALVAYQNALDINPQNVETLQGIASTYEALDNPQAAQEHWQTWLNLVSNDPAYTEEANRVTEHLKALATLSVGTSQGLFP